MVLARLRNLFSRTPSLGTRLFLIALASTLIPLGVMFYTATLQRQSLEAYAKEEALRSVRLISAEQRQHIEQAQKLLAALSHVPAVRTRDAEACPALLSDIMAQFPIYTMIGVVEPNGDMSCSALPLDKPLNVTHRGWFQEVARTKEFVVGDYMIGGITGKPVLALSRPVLDAAGGLEAMSVVGLNLRWLDALIGNAQLPEGATLTIVDAEGTVLASRGPRGEAFAIGESLAEMPLVQQVLAEQTGVTQLEVDTQREVVGFAPLDPDLTAGSVIVSVPRAVAFAEADRIFYRSIVIVLVVCVSLLAATWWTLHRYVARPAQVLLQATTRLRDGDLEARAALEAKGELGQLARHFDAMAASLQAREKETGHAKHQLQEANGKLSYSVRTLEVRNREMTLLSHFGELLQASLSVHEAYRILEQVSGRLFPGLSGEVYIIDRPQGDAVRQASWTSGEGEGKPGPAEISKEVFALTDCWALRRAQAHLYTEENMDVLCTHLMAPSLDGSSAQPHAASEPVATHLCVPLIAQGEVFGMLHLRGDALASEDAQRLSQTAAEQFALSLSGLKLKEELHYQSTRDPLTGLFNRRYLEETLERELARAARNRTPLGIIMIDIDHFKTFNDTFGHRAGDYVLREVAALLQQSVRSSDICCRYGGEELTLVLLDASLENTCKRAEYIREALAALSLTHEGVSLGKLTASFGVVSAPQHGERIDDLLEKADVALYKAKHWGRNRVEAAGVEVQDEAAQEEVSIENG